MASLTDIIRQKIKTHFINFLTILAGYAFAGKKLGESLIEHFYPGTLRKAEDKNQKTEQQNQKSAEPNNANSQPQANAATAETAKEATAKKDISNLEPSSANHPSHEFVGTARERAADAPESREFVEADRPMTTRERAAYDVEQIKAEIRAEERQDRAARQRFGGSSKRKASNPSATSGEAAPNQNERPMTTRERAAHDLAKIKAEIRSELPMRPSRSRVHAPSRDI